MTSPRFGMTKGSNLVAVNRSLLAQKVNKGTDYTLWASFPRPFTFTEAQFQGKALGYLDQFLESARNHPYVLGGAQSNPRDVVHAVCLKRSCLLSASLHGSLSHHAHRVGIAKDLLPMASNSSRAVEVLERPLSHAVDADPRTYFESKQGNSSSCIGLTSG